MLCLNVVIFILCSVKKLIIILTGTGNFYFLWLSKRKDKGMEEGHNHNDDPTPITTEVTTQIMCRLCAKTSLDDNPEENGWTCMSSKGFDSTNKTLASVVNESVPKGIVFDLPADKTPRFLCSQCLGDLQRLVKFLERIRQGQEELRSRLPIPLKRRGRPKKESKNLNPLPLPEVIIPETQEVDLPNSDSNNRAKRLSRRPVRYSEKEWDEETNETIPPGAESKIVEADTSTLAISINEAEEQRQNVAPSLDEPPNAAEIKSERNPLEETDDPTYKITSSSSKFFQKRKKKRGRPRVHRQEDYKCDSCDKMYNNYSSLVYHKIASHQKTSDSECVICKKKFQHKSLLTNHMFTHSTINTFKCEKCNASFNTRSKLAFHDKKVHLSNSNNRRFVCDICGMGFKLSHSLRYHQVIHSDNNPYKCTYCGKEFCRRGNLDQHLRIHTKEKPHKCDFPECNKSFTVASQLRIHKFCHSDTKRLLCILCGKGFNNHSNLKYHMKLHRGEKKFECTICEKKFIDNCALKRHSRLHTGERPFPCDICKKRFIDRPSLKRHKKVHDGKKVDLETSNSSGSLELQQLSGMTSIPSQSLEPPQNFQIAASESWSVNPPVSPEENGTSYTYQLIAPNLQVEGIQVIPMNESLVQVIEPVPTIELVNNPMSVTEGKIIYIYQPQTNELFPVSHLTGEVTENERVDVPKVSDSQNTQEQKLFSNTAEVDEQY